MCGVKGEAWGVDDEAVAPPEPVLLAAFFAGFVLPAMGTWRMVVRSHVGTQS